MLLRRHDGGESKGVRKLTPWSHGLNTLFTSGVVLLWMAGFWRVTGLSGWLRWIICQWTSTTRSTTTGWPCRCLLYFQTLPTATCRCCWRVVSPALFVSPSALATSHLQHWEVRLQRLVQRTPQLSNRAPVSLCWVWGLGNSVFTCL